MKSKSSRILKQGSGIIMSFSEGGDIPTTAVYDLYTVWSLTLVGIGLRIIESVSPLGRTIEKGSLFGVHF